MKQFISELIKINALDKTGDLNAYGNCLTDFSMVSPFIASAILSVSGYPSNKICDFSNSNLQKLTKKELNLLLAILISYIIASPDLCINVYSKKLQEYFDKRSDIITLLLAFLNIAQLSAKEIQSKATEFGFNTQNVIRIKGQMQQISENLFKFNSKSNQESSKDEKFSKYIILFEKLKKHVEDLMKSDELYDFIQNLIEKIGQNNPEWLISRSVEFNRIEEANYEPSFIYKATHPLLNNEKESFIFLKMRPGSIGLDCPGYGFILNITITEVKGDQLKYGTIIHTNKAKEKSNFIPHPVSIEISDVLENNFSEPMINGYLTDYLYNFSPIYLYRKKNEQNEKTVLLFKTKDYYKTKMHYYFSFIPKNEYGIKYFKEAVSSIEKLMPYTPSTILIKNSDCSKVISLHGSGKININCTKHNINSDYSAYKINTKTINYLCQNIDKLNSNQENISIALTGECLSFSLDNADPNDIMNSCSGQVSMPYISQESKFVFYEGDKYQSQLVFVSKEKIITLSNYSLSWFSERCEKRSQDRSNNSNNINIRNYNILSFGNIKQNDESFFLRNANEINPQIINFISESSFLVFTSPNSKLIIKGDIEINNSDLLPSSVTGNISHMFYNYASKYIDGCTLNKPLNFNGFFYAGQNNEYFNQYWNLPNIRKFNLGNGCLCLLCFKKSSVNNSKESIIRNLQSNGVEVSYENVQEYTVYIRHLPEMNLKKDNFIKRVTMVVKQFGSVVDRQYDYEKCNYGKEKCYGKIKIFMFSMYFIIPFAKMITDVLQNKMIQFNIPNKIVDNVLLKDPIISKELQQWFNDNNFHVYEDSGLWYGTENDIQTALDRFKTNPPKFSYIGYSLSNKCNVLSVYNQFNRFYRKRGYSKYLNKSTMTLYLHKDVNIDLILNAEESLYDTNKETKFFVNTFNKDGSSTKMKYNLDQVYKHFLAKLDRMYDPNNDYYNLNGILVNAKNISTDNYQSNEYPIIPFGQQMWIFLNEPKISNQTRTFITACAICCLEKNDNHHQSIFSAMHNFNSFNVSNFNCYIKNTFNELKLNQYIIDQDNHRKIIQNHTVNIKSPINNIQNKTKEITANQKEITEKSTDRIFELQHNLVNMIRSKNSIQSSIENKNETRIVGRIGMGLISIPKPTPTKIANLRQNSIIITRYLRSVLYQKPTNSMIKKFEIRDKSIHKECLEDLLNKIIIKQNSKIVILSYIIIKKNSEYIIQHIDKTTPVKNLPSYLNVQITPSLGMGYVIVVLCCKQQLIPELNINEKNFSIAVLYTQEGIEKIIDNIMKYLKLDSEFSRPIIYQFKENKFNQMSILNAVDTTKAYFATWDICHFKKIEEKFISNTIEDHIKFEKSGN